MEQQRIVTKIEELFELVDLLSSGKKVKLPKKQVAELKVISNANDIKPKFDISSVNIAARTGEQPDKQVVAEAIKQVQEHYDKKN